MTDKYRARGTFRDKTSDNSPNCQTAVYIAWVAAAWVLRLLPASRLGRQPATLPSLLTTWHRKKLSGFRGPAPALRRTAGVTPSRDREGLTVNRSVGVTNRGQTKKRDFFSATRDSNAPKSAIKDSRRGSELLAAWALLFVASANRCCSIHLAWRWGNWQKKKWRTFCLNGNFAPSTRLVSLAARFVRRGLLSRAGGIR